MTEVRLPEQGRHSVVQLLRFTAVGIASNVLGYLLYLLATSLGTEPKVAMTVLYGVGASIGFVGNRRFTFSHKAGLMGAGVRYLIAHALGYLINLSIQLFMVDRMGYPHQLAQAVGICVVAAFLFFMFKYFVFTGAINATVEKP